MGDSTSLVLILAGELLKLAEHLLIMGLHPSEVMQGYDLACKKALEELESASQSRTAHAEWLIMLLPQLYPHPNSPPL